MFASESDIREKHRQLSLIFHPDKQRDERTKEAAQEKFLEVQKAYESVYINVFQPWGQSLIFTVQYSPTHSSGVQWFIFNRLALKLILSQSAVYDALGWFYRLMDNTASIQKLMMMKQASKG